MAFAGFKKQITKTNQFLSEKIGSAKGTELSADYLDNEKSIDTYKSFFDDLLSKTTEYLQPNPAHRTKLLAAKTFHKITGKDGEKPLYPQIEGQISETFNKYGTEAAGNIFGKSLCDIGETFKELEEKKYGLEDTVMQNFINPVTKLRHNDIKEINLHRKKVQSRRLTYDALKRNKEKGTKVTEVEMDDAEKRFLESRNISTEAMINFLDSEAEHINIIASFIKAERDYHHQAADIFESLYSKLMKRRDEANSSDRERVPRSDNSTSKVKSWGSEDSNSLNSQPGSASYSPKQPYVFKKGNDILNAVPTCRALFDFAAESSNELPFTEGSIIKLIQQVDENWFEGEYQGNVGFFPINFVEVLVPLRD